MTLNSRFVISSIKNTIGLVIENKNVKKNTNYNEVK